MPPSLSNQAIILKLKQKVAAANAAKLGATQSNVVTNPVIDSTISSDSATEATSQLIDTSFYNERQLAFIEEGAKGNSVCLIGAAGTGKTTSLKGLLERLTPLVPPFNRHEHKYLPANGVPAIVCTSFTNKAVQNMKAHLPLELRKNCCTIHKLVEFEPEKSDYFDPVTGETKTTMRFVPARDASNPLSKQIQILIIDEPSMVPVSLWNILADAIEAGHKLQVILLGDIQQLPPVFGKSIMIHAIQSKMKTIELNHVYRQALESPIIKLAHQILSGKPIPPGKLESWNSSSEHGSLTIKPWKKSVPPEVAMIGMAKWLPDMIDKGHYEPLNDCILTPYNKSFGTIEINKIVANHLAKLEDSLVWEIYAGVRKIYLRIGDKVLYDKTDWIVTDIARNGNYFGKLPRSPSTTLDYNGIEQNKLAALESDNGNSDSIEDVDDFLAHMASNPNEGDDSPGTRAGSHKITLYSSNLDQEITIDTAGNLNKLDLGYAITVHKSQGSQYNRVFFITHKSQNTMIFRELLYTAVTRAARELFIVCEPDMFVDGILKQRLPGNTLDEKLAAFDLYLRNTKGVETELPKKMYLFKTEGALDLADAPM